MYCGNIIPVGLNQCPKCFNYINSNVNKNRDVFLVMGYIGSFICPLFGLIIGINLLMKEDDTFIMHGIIMIVFAMVMTFIFSSFAGILRIWIHYY